MWKSCLVKGTFLLRGFFLCKKIPFSWALGYRTLCSTKLCPILFRCCCSAFDRPSKGGSLEGSNSGYIFCERFITSSAAQRQSSTQKTSGILVIGLYLWVIERQTHILWPRYIPSFLYTFDLQLSSRRATYGNLLDEAGCKGVASEWPLLHIFVSAHAPVVAARGPQIQSRT